jgi:hypothetical protein
MAGDKPLQTGERQVLRKSFPRRLAWRHSRSPPGARPIIKTVVTGGRVVVGTAWSAAASAMTSMAAASASVGESLRCSDRQQRGHQHRCLQDRSRSCGVHPCPLLEKETCCNEKPTSVVRRGYVASSFLRSPLLCNCQENTPWIGPSGRGFGRGGTIRNNLALALALVGDRWKTEQERRRLEDSRERAVQAEASARRQGIP